MEHIADDDLSELARGERSLGDVPAIEAHLAECAGCSALLSALVSGSGDAPSDRRSLAGTQLGPYRLDVLIGAGAMGEVYRAFDERLHRHVAVKVLSARVDAREIEARAAAAIAHVNVVTVFDTGVHDGVPYVVSELITGETLRSVIDRGPCTPRRALELGVQLARGLAAAHDAGVIHRDLKPGNLILTSDGTLKILDFGLARLASEGEPAAERGTLLGTVGYLAPEQARGERAGAAADIFAAGAILYELATGHRAFDGATFAERLSAVLRDDPPPVPGELGAIITRCLAKDPRARWQSARDLAWTLESQLTAAPPPPRAKPSRRAFLFGGGAALAAGAAGLAVGRMSSPRAAAPARAATPEYRQLTFRQGRVASARFTRDGGSLLYSAAWDGQPLATFTARVGGGGTRALDVPAGQLLAISSRGELALSLGHRYIDGFHQRGQLALAPLEGGAPRGLGVEVQDADFSPDGATLAIVRRAGTRFRLELPLGTTILEAGWISHPRVAPDGGTVACCVHETPRDDRGDLVIVPANGGSPRVLAGDWSSIDGVAWAADGRAVWISASREGGNNAAWLIGLDGEIRAHVPAAGRLRVYDVAPDGELAVSHVSARMRMFARARDAASEAELALSDVSLVGDISLDGRHLVFAEFGDVDTASGAYLRPTDGGAPVRLGEALPADLADDDRGVLAVDYTGALVALPVGDGTPRPMPVHGLVRVRSPRWAAGETIVTVGAVGATLGPSTTPGRPPRVWRVARDGTATPLTDEGSAGLLGASPDGRAIAFVSGDRLVVIDDITQPSAPRTLPGSFADASVCGWSSDGRAVFVRSASPPIAVDRVDLATGAVQRVLDIAPSPVGLRGVDKVVVDGEARAYAYSFGQEMSRLFTMKS